ncbi:MAG: PEP-CTERM sorting domain-containing protein [PVC group bacterium]|nr:PEP-CTERM sorting domain-containing protein [PVC group bacterium]
MNNLTEKTDQFVHNSPAGSIDFFSNNLIWGTSLEVYNYNTVTSATKSLSYDMSYYFSFRPAPSIYDKKVIWRTHSNFSIYDLETDTETMISNPHFVNNDAAIWENNVVTSDLDGVYVYDLSQNTELQIVDRVIWKDTPDAFENTVVWVEGFAGKASILGYNIETDIPMNFAVNDYGNKEGLKIWGDFLVWSEDRYGNWDIFGYDINAGEEFQITNDPFDQKNPAIYRNMIAWEDNRNGHWDIYGTVIPEPSTIFMFLSGLLGCYWIKKKNKISNK